MARYCRIGTSHAELAVYAGDSSGAIAIAEEETTAWLQDRLDGVPATATECP
jgi:hypothetical protein